MLPPVVMLMFITTTWAEDATIAAVISYAIFYGGFGQMVAGVFEVCTTLAAGNFSQVTALEWLKQLCTAIDRWTPHMTEAAAGPHLALLSEPSTYSYSRNTDLSSVAARAFTGAQAQTKTKDSTCSLHACFDAAPILTIAFLLHASAIRPCMVCCSLTIYHLPCAILPAADQGQHLCRHSIFLLRCFLDGLLRHEVPHQDHLSTGRHRYVLITLPGRVQDVMQVGRKE